MTHSNQSITGIITWSAREGVDVPSAHHYRATVNVSGGTPTEVPVGRPGKEVWYPDQLIYPLVIGDRIHGARVGQHIQWAYVERPYIGTCEDLPGMVQGTMPNAGAGLPLQIRGSLATRLMLAPRSELIALARVLRAVEREEA